MEFFLSLASQLRNSPLPLKLLMVYTSIVRQCSLRHGTSGARQVNNRILTFKHKKFCHCSMITRLSSFQNSMTLAHCSCRLIHFYHGIFSFLSLTAQLQLDTPSSLILSFIIYILKFSFLLFSSLPFSHLSIYSLNLLQAKVQLDYFLFGRVLLAMMATKETLYLGYGS